MAIKAEDIQRVREATDIVALVAETVVLRQRGSDFWGCCPFHDEKTPSFKVNPSTQLWHCFGCSSGGDVFSYLMRRENLDFPSAVRYLAERAHIEIVETNSVQNQSKRGRLFEVCDKTADFYHQILLKSPDTPVQEARKYLSGREFNLEVSKRWKLGYAPGNNALVNYLLQQGYSRQELLDANVCVQRNNKLVDRFYERIIFPIEDEFSHTIGFGGRIIGKGEPKYLNSQETPLFHKSKSLFALNKAKETIVSQASVCVVEGYTDVISLHEAGITNVVATLGTALTSQHVRTLSRFSKKIIYIFDGDEAGQKAAERSIQFIQQSQADFYCATLPQGLDPADYVIREGKAGFVKVLESAQPLMRFVIDRRLSQFNLNVPEQRLRALTSAVEVLTPLKGTLLAEDYCNYIADRLETEVMTVKRALQQVKSISPSSSAQISQNQYNNRADLSKKRMDGPQSFGTFQQGYGRSHGSGGVGDFKGSNFSGRVVDSKKGDFSGRVVDSKKGDFSGRVDGAGKGNSSSRVDEVGKTDHFAGAPSAGVAFAGALSADVALEGTLSAGPTSPDNTLVSGDNGGDRGRDKSRDNSFQSNQSAGIFNLSAEDLQILQVEKELLSFIALYPDRAREQSESLSDLSWLDEHHEMMCWAMLATPAKARSQEVVDAARAVYERADQVLSSGYLSSDTDVDEAHTLVFLIDRLRLANLNREVRRGRSKLKHGGLDPELYDEVFEQIVKMQQEIRKLENKLRESSKRTG